MEQLLNSLIAIADDNGLSVIDATGYYYSNRPGWTLYGLSKEKEIYFFIGYHPESSAPFSFKWGTMEPLNASSVEDVAEAINARIARGLPTDNSRNGLKMPVLHQPK